MAREATGRGGTVTGDLGDSDLPVSLRMKDENELLERAGGRCGAGMGMGFEGRGGGRSAGIAIGLISGQLSTCYPPGRRLCAFSSFPVPTSEYFHILHGPRETQFAEGFSRLFCFSTHILNRTERQVTGPIVDCDEICVRRNVLPLFPIRGVL